jgi:hypothetical protein
MNLPEKCKHDMDALYCSECFQEIHQSILKMKLKEAKEFDCIVSGEELDISSPEFLRQT